MSKSIDNLEKSAGLNDYYKNSGRSRNKVRLEWNNINYRLVNKDPISKEFKERIILDDVSGFAESGQLLAILGPSGCGKTSLMNILAAKLPAGGSEYQNLSGSIILNGEERDESKFRKISSYVLQDDFMYPHLTVLEVLTLASHFYCPETMSDDEKAKLVNAVIMELGLVKAKDTLIGDDKVRGVSGGERKRTNIGIQLITDPAILFLDEPTTGLDSFQALAVMECIKGLALNGRLVVAVIHQPRSQIYSMFDQMLLLSSGKNMFFGQSTDALIYFEKNGYPCPEEFNPADHYLDMLSSDNRSAELTKTSCERVTNLANLWLKESDSIINSVSKSKLTSEYELEGGESNTTTTRDRSSSIVEIGLDQSCASFLMQLKLLSWRTYTEVKRDYPTLIAGCVIFSFMGLIIGGVYNNIGFSQTSIQNRNGCLYFVGVNAAFNGLFAVLNVFPKEKNIVNTERANRAYTITPYFIAKFFVEIPARVLPAILYGSILYWLVELNPDRFWMFLFILISVSITSVSLGLLVSAVMPTFEAAVAVGPLIVVMMILFGGFYIDIESLPPVADLVPYVSIMRWSFQALTINEYKGLKFKCVEGKKCLETGEQVLESLGFDGVGVGFPLFGLYMLLLFLVLASYLILLRSEAQYSPLNFVGSKYFAITEEITNKSDPDYVPQSFWNRIFGYEGSQVKEIAMVKVSTTDTDADADADADASIETVPIVIDK
jgi:ABC-type multidrug transport system ATPase subunit